MCRKILLLFDCVLIKNNVKTERKVDFTFKKCSYYDLMLKCVFSKLKRVAIRISQFYKKRLNKYAYD